MCIRDRPGDVLSVWAAPDGPEDLARQEAAQLVARDLSVGLAASHLAATPDASCLHDAAMLALPFHDSAPLDAFDGTGRAFSPWRRRASGASSRSSAVDARV